ncbi:MAG: hypothetical protein ABII23_02680 [bacterium]
MSWKLFGQIVLLIFITAVILGLGKSFSPHHKKWGKCGMKKTAACGMSLDNVCPSCAGKTK